MGILKLDTSGGQDGQGGAPLPFGRRYVFVQDTDSLAPLYSDPGLTETTANPLLADETGVFDLCYVIDGKYRIELRTRDEEPVQTYEDIIVTPSGLQGFLRGFATPADLSADTELSYTSGQGKQKVVEGDVVLVTLGNVYYRVMASDTTDEPDLTTGDGVKMLLLSSVQGFSPAEFGAALDGVTDDTAQLQTAFSSASKLTAHNIATACVSATLSVPSSAHLIDLQPITLCQGDGANLEKIVSHRGYGNNYGRFKMRVDGNRANNTTPVVGCQIDATMAGDLIEVDVSGDNCDTLLKTVKEVEHCYLRASGRQCGTVFQVDTTTNTSDENNIDVYGYQVDTLFKTTGLLKSSGQVDLFGEVIDGWAIDMENGWYSLGGVVRSCGVSYGGGCRVTTTSGGRLHFRGLQLYGRTPSANNGTWGLLVDSLSTWCEGDLILGTFDGGAWIKSCKESTHLRLNITGTATYSDGLRLGEASAGKSVDSSVFDVAVSGSAGYGLNLDSLRNSTVVLDGAVRGDLADVRISNDSFDNRLEVGRGLALSVSLINERTAHDNLVLFKGSYTPSDINQINGGVYFSGMWVEEMRLEGGLRAAAYYDSDVNAWVSTSAMMDEKGQGAIANAANQINAANKYRGKLIWDATNDRVMRALGNTPTATWISLDGTGSITPS